MLLQKVNKAIEELKTRQMFGGKILIGLSGGKDSLVITDLALKVFPKERILPFFMEFLPDLQADTERLRAAEEHFKIKTLRTGCEFLKDFKNGNYGWEGLEKEALPDISRKDFYVYLMEKYQADSMILGVKSNDSVQVRRQADKNNFLGNLLKPLWNWSTAEVVQYLIMNKIPLPKQSMDGLRGVDLMDDSLLYIYENYPADFEKLEEYFPFIRAVVVKYERYGLKVKKHFV